MFSSLLNLAVSTFVFSSTGRPFHACGAATENAFSWNILINARIVDDRSVSIMSVHKFRGFIGFRNFKTYILPTTTYYLNTYYLSICLQNRHKLHLRSVLCTLMVCLGGPYGQLVKPTSSHGSHMPVPRGGVFATPVRGMSLLRWSPDCRKRTICLQISQLSMKWWPLRMSNSSIKLSQTPPTYLLHSSHPRNHTHIICESAPMTSRSLHTKLTF